MSLILLRDAQVGEERRDSGIHTDIQRTLRFLMDRRVKPGDDGLNP
jgi:hypothetical protein